jgi:hypothetical protein
MTDAVTKSVVDLGALIALQLGTSRSEARRLIGTGAVTLDGDVVVEHAVELTDVEREARVGDRTVRIPARPSESVFVEVRQFAVQVGRSVLMVPVDTIQEAINEAERALAVGPITNPTLYQQAGEELQQHVRLLRALLRFRLALEEFRPAEQPDGTGVS